MGHFMPLRSFTVEAAIFCAAGLLAEARVMKVLGTEVRLCLLCGCTGTCVVAVSTEMLVTRVLSTGLSITEVLITEMLCLLGECTSVRDCAVAHSSAVVRVVSAKICILAVAGRCIVWSYNVWTIMFFQCVLVCILDIYSGMRFLSQTILLCLVCCVIVP